MYRRRRGDRPSYSRAQTQRYFSQVLRWRRGYTISPADQSLNPDGSQSYFFRGRSPTGFWETKFNPGGSSTSRPNPYTIPFDPGSSSCALTFCLGANPLQYVKVKHYAIRWAWVDRIEGGWNGGPSLDGFVFEIDEEFYFKIGSIAPPAGDVRIPTNTGACPALSDGCRSYVETYTEVTATSSYSVTYVCVGGSASYTLGIANNYINPLTPPPLEQVYPDGGSGSSGLVNPLPGRQAETYSLEFFYGSDPSNLLSSSCGFNVPGFPPAGGGSPLWLCNCPDQTQQIGSLSYSRFSSERQSRSWAGSGSHNAQSGPCKHIYAAANFRGQPFPRPSSDDRFWDYPYQVDRPSLDWADPEEPPQQQDWTSEQYRAWRDRRFRDRQADIANDRSDRANRQRMFRGTPQGQRWQNQEARRRVQQQRLLNGELSAAEEAAYYESQIWDEE